jgi:cobalt-precorrin 5A hydrolase
MKLAVIALTNSGADLGYRLEEELADVDLYLPTKVEPSASAIEFKSSLSDLVEDLFADYEGLIFIMAVGIVVRILAPYIEDKRRDPAVVTIDDTGANVISTLSGHIGGANDLTAKLAALIGANPVITTATDCHNKLAFDLLAQQLDAQIMPFSNLKLANAAVVNNQQVDIFTDLELDLDLAANINLLSRSELGSREGFPVVISNQRVELSGNHLQLVPRNIVVGIGCRRGVSSQQIKAAILFALDQLNLKQASIKSVATIDLKEDETGILEVVTEWKVPLDIISREQIRNCEFEYTSSEFVEEQIGVGGVCEPAALLSSRGGELLLEKTSKNKVTVALVEENCML